MDGDEQLKSDINTLIHDTCLRLKLPLATRTTSQVIYNYVSPALVPQYSPARLVLTTVFLAAKITESSIKPSVYKTVTGFTIDTTLEMAIIKQIDFKFDFFDIHAYIKDVCNTLRLKKDQKLERLERAFSSRRLNRIGFIGEGFNVRDVCLAVLSDSEVRLFENVFCARADWDEIRRIRSDVLE